MVADTWVKTNSLDYGCRVETFDLGIRVKLIEIAHTQCKICVCKELYSLGLFKSHEKGRDVLLYRTLLQQAGKLVRSLLQVVTSNGLDGVVFLVELVNHLGVAHNDAAWVEVVVESLALA